jgi:hypothetical protein
MNDRGTFRVMRSVFDNPALCGEIFNKVTAWLWLVSEAAWDNRTVRVAQYVINLSRGQLVCSLRYLAKKWDWEYKRVDRFLAKLRNEGMIRTGTEDGITVVTIIGYDELQSAERAGQQRDSKGTANRTGNGTDDNYRNSDAADTSAIEDLLSETAAGTAADTPRGERLAENRDKTNKQINKRKNICAPKGALSGGWPADDFDIFYGHYPRKKTRKSAEKAFEKVRASDEISFDELIARTKRFAAQSNSTDRTFIPYPASWLNAGGHLDIEDGMLMNRGGLNPEPRDPKTFTTAEWVTRLAHFAVKREWNRYWVQPQVSPDALRPPR